jgi:hypothetical protein
MKRSKFFENWVFSAKELTARSVTSWASAAATLSARAAASKAVVFIAISPSRIHAACTSLRLGVRAAQQQRLFPEPPGRNRNIRAETS